MVESLNNEASTSTLILDHLRSRLGLKSDTELALRLGVSPQAVSKARRAGKVPKNWEKKLLGDTETYTAPPSQDTKAQATCPHCAELEEELKTERAERRELAAENRQLWRENGELKTENGELKARIARLEAGMDRRAEPPVEASLFDERPPIPSSSQTTPPTDEPV